MMKKMFNTILIFILTFVILIFGNVSLGYPVKQPIDRYSCDHKFNSRGYCSLCGEPDRSSSGSSGSGGSSSSNDNILKPACYHSYGSSKVYYNRGVHIQKCTKGCGSYILSQHSYGSDGKCACGLRSNKVCSHVYGDWKSVSASSHRKECINGCKAYMTESHSYNSEGVCTGCGHAGRKNCTHVFSSWSNVGANHAKTCIKCGKKETASHSYVWITKKAPTCTSTGLKAKMCAVCGAAGEGLVQRLGILPHSFDRAGKCSCGARTTPEPEYFYEEEVVEIYVGESVDLATMELGDKLTANSKGKNTATVDTSGIITGKKAGETVIYIKDGDKIVDEIKVIVKKESISMETDSITIRSGQDGKIPVKQDTAKNGEIIYTCDKPDYITINSDGTFVANENLEPGKEVKVKITASTTDANGKTLKTTYTVNVTSKDVHYDVYNNNKTNAAVVAPKKSADSSSGANQGTQNKELPGVVIYFGGDGTLTTGFTQNNGETQYMKETENGSEYSDYILAVQVKGQQGDSATARNGAKDVIPIIRQLIDEGKIDPNQIKIVGHSRGGIATTALLGELLKEENSDIKVAEAIIVDGSYTDNLDTYRGTMDNGTKLQMYASDRDKDGRNIANASRNVVEALNNDEKYKDMFYGEEVKGENHSSVLKCDKVAEALDKLAGKNE